MFNAALAANPGAMPDLNADPEVLQAQAAEGMAYTALATQLHEKGVMTPAVIRAIRPTGEADMSGGREVEFDVSVRPEAGDPHEALVRQHMTPASIQALSVGRSVTVKYDPDAPGAALIFDW